MPAPPPIDPRRDVTGLVLAGGRALRMGGAAKGLAELHGETLIARVIARLRPQVGTLLLNANRPDYDDLGLPVIADVIGGFPGPLAGLHAGLLACATPWLLTVPCDAPFVPKDLAARLAASASRQRRLLVAASLRGIEPGFMLCHVSLAKELGHWLGAGGRKVRDWLAAAGATEIAFADADADAFANINTPEELARLNALR
ncbi:MAG: molybdenum cofactor guanylyltransferase MobA [Sulfurisoma sp.]|nr:molybdenum cofactor guanylyltransferase MobA [Sulfurisoma sp.]